MKNKQQEYKHSQNRFFSNWRGENVEDIYTEVEALLSHQESSSETKHSSFKAQELLQLKFVTV